MGFFWSEEAGQGLEPLLQLEKMLLFCLNQIPQTVSFQLKETQRVQCVGIQSCLQAMGHENVSDS